MADLGVAGILSRLIADLRAKQDEAIAAVLARTPGDQRGLLITTSTVFDFEAMTARADTTVQRSSEVPAGTIAYRNETPGITYG